MAVELELRPVKLEVPEEIATLWNERDGPIVKYPDPVLRQVAKPLERPTSETRQLVERMKSAMVAANGVGLAAPQLGVSERVLIYKVSEDEESVRKQGRRPEVTIRVIVNPKIISMKGEQIGPEGCLSIPMLQGDVKRANEIIVKGMDMLGRPFRRRATEFEARVIQHEVDHLDGVLFIDRAELETLHWLIAEEGEESEAVEE